MQDKDAELARICAYEEKMDLFDNLLMECKDTMQVCMHNIKELHNSLCEFVCKKYQMKKMDKEKAVKMSYKNSDKLFIILFSRTNILFYPYKFT